MDLAMRPTKPFVAKTFPLALASWALLSVAAFAGQGPMVFRYSTPAEKWTDASPVGNGRLGAMVFGRTDAERIQFNEDTVWLGKPRDYAHEGAVEHLPAIRRLLTEGKRREAEKLAGREFMSVPLRQKAYQPFGDLNISFPGHGEVEDYRRELDIDSAIATVRYKVGDVTFTREVLASHPDNVIVVRLSADKPGQLNFTASLSSRHAATTTEAVGKQLSLTGGVIEAPVEYGFLSGQSDPGGGGIVGAIKFEARLVASSEGGRIAVTDRGLQVTAADSATLILAGHTNFKNYRDVSADPARRCEETLAKLKGKSYADIRKAHVADHQKLFRRVELDLGETDAAKLDTPERIARFREGKDPQLAAILFQFGRYLLIASSRPGSQPANLQGIWNDQMQPAWESKWTTNINCQMNYWPAEVCNLAECHLPLFDLLDDVSVTGRSVARKHYGARGWVLHHNTDLWRGAAPINASNHGIWPVGGAWLCQHLWWRYEFSGDREFLAERAYPIIKGAARFHADHLTEDAQTGWLISSPSNSPENGGLVAGPTMDHQIIRDLFSNCIEATEILGVDRDFRKELAEKRKRIAPNQIGRLAQLQEWLEDKDDPNNKHGHISHLWGFCPGGQINLRGTPELSAAVRKSLELRGDRGGGWPIAWRISMWARFEQPERAYRNLRRLFSPAGKSRGGMCRNMFDTLPPFQIDATFGATAGIAEMLIQSHADEIAILPALPAAWPAGKVKGLRTRGGLQIDIHWQAGKARRIVLKPTIDGTHKIRPPKGQRPSGVALDNDGTFCVDVKAGGVVEVGFE